MCRAKYRHSKTTKFVLRNIFFLNSRVQNEAVYNTVQPGIGRAQVLGSKKILLLRLQEETLSDTPFEKLKSHSKRMLKVELINNFRGAYYIVDLRMHAFRMTL